MVATASAAAVCCVALPLGLWALYAAKSDVYLSAVVASSGYFQTLTMWPFGCMAMLVFAYGFRWYSVLGIIAYLAVVSLQGYHRFMVLFPLIFFSAYFLQTRRRLWPTWPIQPQWRRWCRTIRRSKPALRITRVRIFQMRITFRSPGVMELCSMRIPHRGVSRRE
jgi:hypothetical protein